MKQSLLLVLLAGAAAPQTLDVEAALRRVAEEASRFSALAPNAFAEETVQQRVILGPPRFRPRIGSSVQTPQRKVVRREVVSEFGYSFWKDTPGVVHEFRKVVSVDGRNKLNVEKARATLTAGLRSKEDEIRKQMLRDFEKTGLVGGVTDLTPMLLLFLKPNQANYSFAPARQDRLGADSALVLSYEQTGGEQEMTIFEGREAIHRKLRGELWVRQPDGLPLRVTAVSEREVKEEKIADGIQVDYAMSPHAAIMPAAAVYRQWVGGELRVENVYRYSSFRRFGAETEIRFNEVPQPPGKP